MKITKTMVYRAAREVKDTWPEITPELEVVRVYYHRRMEELTVTIQGKGWYYGDRDWVHIAMFDRRPTIKGAIASIMSGLYHRADILDIDGVQIP